MSSIRPLGAIVLIVAVLVLIPELATEISSIETSLGANDAMIGIIGVLTLGIVMIYASIKSTIL